VSRGRPSITASVLEIELSTSSSSRSYQVSGFYFVVIKFFGVHQVFHPLAVQVAPAEFETADSS